MVSSSDLTKLSMRWARASEQKQIVARKIEADELLLQQTLKRQETVLKAQALIQTTAQETQNQLTYHVQALVQNALDAVFPTVYLFKTAFELRRGQTEVVIWLDKDGEAIDPRDAAGGGVVDVVCFALRVVAWSLSQTSPVLILDEPFKWVSAGLRPICGQLLRGISDRLGLQIIMVTHDPELVEQADRIFLVEQKARRSRISVREGTRA